MDTQICIFNCVRWTGLRDKGGTDCRGEERERERRGTRFDLLILERLAQFNILPCGGERISRCSFTFPG